MKRNIKSLAAVLLAIVMIAGVAACAGSSDPAPQPGAADSGAQDQPAADSGGGGGDAPASSGGSTRDFVPIPDGPWNAPYEQTVNITSGSIIGLDWVFENGDDSWNNPWTRAWKDTLNIEVTPSWAEAGSGDAYQTKVNMAIAAGDLPDVVKVTYVQYRQMRAADLLADVGDVYRTVASQRIRDYEKEDPNTIKITSEGDSIYGIPNYYYGQIDNPRFIWVRNDWYAEAGRPELKTVADFENLAKQFIAEGKGLYGMSIENTLSYLYMTGPMFGVYLGMYDNPGNPYFWYADETGRIKAGETHPEMKTALETWARWYKEGIISPDYVNMNYDKMLEECINGRAGFNPFWQWQGWVVGPNIVSTQGNNEAYMIPLIMPTLDGSQVLGQVGFPNSESIVVSKNCNNPGAVMKLLSFTDYVMFDPGTVLTEEEFKGFTDGQREHASHPFSIIDPTADMLQYQHVSMTMEDGDTSRLFTAGMKKKYEDSINWRDNQDPGGLGAFLQQGLVGGSAYHLSASLLNAGNVKRTDMWGPPPEAFDQTANTQDIFAMGFSEIITGVRPVDDYESIVAAWYAGGGQILEDAVNAEYGG